MDVHIDVVRIDVQIDEISRGRSLRNQPLIALHHGFVEVRAAEKPPVHKKHLISQALSRLVRTADEARYVHKRSFHLHIHGFRCYIRPCDVLDSEFEGFCRLQHIDLTVVVKQSEGNVGAGVGNSLKLSDYVLKFHAFALEELASCGDIVEKVADREIRTHRSCCGRR